MKPSPTIPTQPTIPTPPKKQPGIIYREVSCVPGMSCTRDGSFMYRGRRKKVLFATKNFGNGKATARVTWMEKGTLNYIQAAKAVAMAWKCGYDEKIHHIIYKDGDIHNINADNLKIVSYAKYNEYKMRNSGNKAASLEERKRKLQLVADEALMTKHYLETLDMSPINRHVNDYLFLCLMLYCKETLHLGESVAREIVPSSLARMYECIMNGMCLYNYERFCKKLLLNYKKKKNFGLTGKVPKPIEIKVEQLNLDCLWEKFKKGKITNRKNLVLRGG